MNYTIGNWTIESLVTDSISDTKNLAIPDLSYNRDYTVAASSSEEVILHNITGETLQSQESVRYARTSVSDVYKNTNIPSGSRLTAKEGTRTLCEVQFALKATNSISGSELSIPVKGWICVQLPTANMVSPDVAEYALLRTIATAFNTGSSDKSRLVEIVRGDLNPN